MHMLMQLSGTAMGITPCHACYHQRSLKPKTAGGTPNNYISVPGSGAGVVFCFCFFLKPSQMANSQQGAIREKFYKEK